MRHLREMEGRSSCRTGMLCSPGGVQYKLVLLRWSRRLRHHDRCAHLMATACIALHLAGGVHTRGKQRPQIAMRVL